MPNTNKQNLMDNYVLGRLSSLERKQLDQLIAEDPKFQVELDMHQDIADTAVLLGNQELRKMLNGIHAKVVTGKESMSNSWKKPLLLLLGIVATLLAVYFGKSVNEDMSVAEPMRYASYYTIDEGTVRSTDVQTSDLGTEYITAYKQQKFQMVLDLLGPNLPEATNEIKLVAAIAALEVGDKALARTQLQSITVSDDFYYVDHARWYQALLYLSEGQKDAAADLLNSLAKNPKADHHKDAVKLLQTIK